MENVIQKWKKIKEMEGDIKIRRRKIGRESWNLKVSEWDMNWNENGRKESLKMKEEMGMNGKTDRYIKEK